MLPSCVAYTVAVRFRPLDQKQDVAKLQHHRRTPRLPLVPVEKLLEKAWSVQESGPSANSVLGTTSTVTQKGVVRKVPGRNIFAMDAVFAAEEETRSIYQQMVKPIVLSVANGQHGTVFVYGQTGSGKTYTMQGGDVDPFIGSRPPGIIQMAAADIFARIAASGSRDWAIKASFFEIYNEEVRDLLVPDENNSLSSSCDKSCLPVLSVREDSAGNVRVRAHEETVESVHDVARILRKGNGNRACAATNNNSRSSRSHAIFRFWIETRPRVPDDDGSDMVRTSILNLVDLAGSENGHGNTSARRREGGKINQSLLALTRVVQSLGLPEKKRPKYIGYRDSKLTRILKPSLEGEACMAILCCASPARIDLEETRSTLKFAASSKLIKVNPPVNEVSETSVNRLKQELSTVKECLTLLQEKYRQQELLNTSVPESLPPVITPPLRPPRIISTQIASGHFEIEGFTDEEGSTDYSRDRDILPYEGAPPPVREVAVVLDPPEIGPLPAAVAHTNAEAGERAVFLQEKLDTTYDFVARMVQDMQGARDMIREVHDNNLQLETRMAALEQELEDQSSKEDRNVPPWWYGAALFLYAFELKELLLSGLIFLFLSQNFAAGDLATEIVNGNLI